MMDNSFSGASDNMWEPAKTARVHEFYFEQLLEAFTSTNIFVAPLEKNKSTETCRSIAQVLFAREENAARAFGVLNNSDILKNESYQLSLTSSSSSHINDLPNEFLIKILSKLSMKDKLTIEKVCTRWKNVAPACWANEKKFSVSSVNPKMAKEEFLQYITRCGPYCEDIQIYLDDDSYQLSLALEKCVNLNSLRLNRILLAGTDSEIRPSFNGLKLNRIMIQRYCYRRHFSLSSLLETMSEQTTEIHVEEGNLNCFSGMQPEPEETAADFSKFKNLRALTLGDHLNGKNFLGFEQLTNLVCLNIDGTCLPANILEAMKNFTKLEHLALYESRITDDILISILENNKNLEFLNINASFYISKRSIISLSQHEKLRVLMMHSIEVDFCKYLWGFPNLRVLCCDPYEYTPAGDWFHVIHNSHHLKVLAMRDYSGELKPIFENIARRSSRGEMLMPEIPHPGVYLWIEENAVKEKLQPFFPWLHRYFGSWVTEDISWYTHDYIRIFD